MRARTIATTTPIAVIFVHILFPEAKVVTGAVFGCAVCAVRLANWIWSGTAAGEAGGK